MLRLLFWGSSHSRLLFEVGMNDSADIFALQNPFRATTSRCEQHGPTNLLRGQNMIGKCQPEQREQWFGEHVKGSIDGRLGSRSVYGLDDARTEHVCCGEWQSKQ